MNTYGCKQSEREEDELYEIGHYIKVQTDDSVNVHELLNVHPLPIPSYFSAPPSFLQ